MNAAVNALYAEYLDHTGGDTAAAASLALAAVMLEHRAAVGQPQNQPLTVPEVAKLLRVSPDKVLSWIRSGRLRGYNVAEHENGRPKYRVNRDDLDAFANRRCVARPTPAGRPVGSRRGRFADLPDELPDI
jgi:excisionase family DNA binding protein